MQRSHRFGYAAAGFAALCALAVGLQFRNPPSETVPPTGLLRLTVGGGGVEFDTVTATPAEVVFWFNESVAIAVNVWLALEAVAVFQAIE